MVKNPLLAICAFAFLLLASQTALACSCSYSNVKGVFSSSDAVFIGKVSKITTAKEASVGLLLKESGTLELLKTPRLEKSIYKVQNVSLEVIETFKGATEKNVVLYTSLISNGSCGVPFKVGESFLVFAGKTQPMLSKDEAVQPKENWTLEMRLKAEADKFNEKLPPYETSICSRTERLRFMKDELLEIHYFLKNGTWKEPETSPFMPPLLLFMNQTDAQQTIGRDAHSR